MSRSGHLDEPFKSVLKLYSGSHMQVKTVLACCYRSSFSYWPVKDPFLMRFQWENSTVLDVLTNVFQSLSDANMRLQQSELIK